MWPCVNRRNWFPASANLVSAVAWATYSLGDTFARPLVPSKLREVVGKVWGVPVNALAVAWGVAMIANMGWPRAEVYGDEWHERFAAVLQAIDAALPLRVWRDAHAMIREAGPLLPSAALISLDHDLEPEPGASDPGDG